MLRAQHQLITAISNTSSRGKAIDVNNMGVRVSGVAVTTSYKLLGHCAVKEGVLVPFEMALTFISSLGSLLSLVSLWGN